MLENKYCTVYFITVFLLSGFSFEISARRKSRMEKTDNTFYRRARDIRPIQDAPSNANFTLDAHQAINGSGASNNGTRPVLPSFRPSVPDFPLPDANTNITLLCQSYLFSCNGRCKTERLMGVTTERRQCFCDHSCEQFQDCCADYDQYCPTSGVMAKANESKPWQCVMGGNVGEADGIWMISACSKDWTRDDVRNGCNRGLVTTYANHKDTLPVIDREGKTYKNHFCAQCNGVSLHQVTFYQLNFSCFVSVPVEYNRSESLRFLFNYCSKISWQPPEGSLRRYCFSFPTERYCSSPLEPGLDRKCFHGPIRVVYDLKNKRNFINSFCARCHGVTNLQCGPGRVQEGDGEIEIAKPFSFLLDPGHGLLDDGEATVPKVRKREILCGPGNVFDFYLQTCRRGVKPLQPLPHEMTYSISVSMKSNLSYPELLIGREIFRKAFFEALDTTNTQISNIEIRNSPGPITTLVFDIHLNMTQTSFFSVEKLEHAIRNLSVVVVDVKFTTFQVSVKPLLCLELTTIQPHEYVIQKNTVEITNTREILKPTEFYSNETEWKNGTLYPKGFLFVCRQEINLNCSEMLVSLRADEYVLLSNGSLYRNISRQLYKPDRFQSTNGTIWICTNFSQNFTTEDDIITVVIKRQSNLAQVILTYVGLSLSVICLVVVLVTFFIFTELRTLPGINLMNLSFALFMTHSLYFATGQVKAQTTCMLTAIMLHCFLLASFFWMSIIAFDTWRAMSKIRVRRTKKNCKKFYHILHYIALGWLPPFIFVAICVALDQSKAFTFDYGGIKGCWINNREANLYFFILPAALSVAFNAVFFALTVRVIKRTRNQAEHVTNQSQHRTNAGIFFRIFVLMGFTWLFGFLRLEWSYFDYPFIVLTTLQGVYIAVAFVFTARVRKLYRALFAGVLCKSAIRATENISPPVVLSKYVETSER